MAIMAATASSASGPAARTVTCWPLVAPRPITPSTLLASAVLPPTVSDTVDANRAAATASAPAGRACRSPVSVMPRPTAGSELAGMPCLLSGGGHRLDVSPARGRHRRRHRALHERGIRHDHAVVWLVLEHGADGEHRAAEVGDDDHSGSGVGVREAALD